MRINYVVFLLRTYSNTRFPIGFRLRYINSKKTKGEEFYKILKSELRLEGCSARDSIAQINHIYFVLIAFCRSGLFRSTENIQSIFKIRAIFFDCDIPNNL
jgi:hypothetical protein